MTSPTYSACPKGLMDDSTKNTVNFWNGGMCCTSTVTVSKMLICGLPSTTVTSAVAFGNSDLMPDGTSGNCTIKVGATEASTLTLGAICSPVPKAGVRN